MLIFLEIFFLVLVPVEVYSCWLGDKEVCSLGGVVDPVHDEHLFVVFFDGNGELSAAEVGEEGPLDGEEQHHVFIVVVGEVGDDVGLSQLEDLEVVLVNDVEDVPVVNDGDVAFVVVKIFGVGCQPLLYLLDLLVLLREGQLQQARGLLHVDIIILYWYSNADSWPYQDGSYSISGCLVEQPLFAETLQHRRGEADHLLL